jgi:S1-C subfamily serine protease
MQRQPPLLFQIIVLVALGALLGLLVYTAGEPAVSTEGTATSTQPSAAAAADREHSEPTTETPIESPAEATAPKPDAEPAPVAEVAPSTAIESPAQPTVPREIERVTNAYATPPLPFVEVNVAARSALVNILCNATGGSVRPISGSGVIIDPRGIILTNAHVAQYVLLSASTRLDLSCFIRTGSPAKSRWVPHMLYLPNAWINDHAADISLERPTGTGEHDYALLFIGESVDALPRPSSFPYLAPDAREAIAFTGDQVLTAAYPAEFFGGQTTHLNLHPVTSIATIGQMYTFGSGNVDAFSLGGIIAAQSGSSGGGAINAWKRLVGILTTTSDGATTAERDLRAISLASIDRDFVSQTGMSLASYIAADPAQRSRDFMQGEAPALLRALIEEIRN